MLIDCPECGARISSNATSCPQCGHPIKASVGSVVASGPTSSARKRASAGNFVAGVFVAIIAAWACVFALNNYSSVFGRRQHAPAPVTIQDAIKQFVPSNTTPAQSPWNAGDMARIGNGKTAPEIFKTFEAMGWRDDVNWRDGDFKQRALGGKPCYLVPKSVATMYEAVKAINARDTQGLLNLLVNNSVVAVSSGTPIKIIETSHDYVISSDRSEVRVYLFGTEKSDPNDAAAKASALSEGLSAWSFTAFVPTSWIHKY